ncbi:MAG: DUF5107 domain-containing protein [Balneolaceae bacterium]
MTRPIDNPIVKKLTLCGPLLLLLLIFARPASSQVVVTEQDRVIPTYEVKEADPNPIFYNGRRYQGAQGRVYPYPLYHNLTNNLVDQSYREIILENDYVEISVIPELGGRIYYARDKVNDYDYLYHNEVVKPALIGMTGAWISGGVEWNIPHHHRATSFTPVDYRITEQEDGSKTVWVGETEWRHRTRWIVGLTLHPESTLLETTIRVFNTSPFQNSLLVFANAAVHTNEQYQVFFPPATQWATFHRKNQFSEWPVSHQYYDGADYTDGVDVSRWANHSKPTSFFEWGNRGNFVAGIDHGARAGTVIFGNRHINPGKKLWSWGNNPNGEMWDNLLTDENGPYIELMFGSYSDNQPDYSWMQAGETKETTYWFAPLKELQDVKHVNRNAIVSFDEEDGSLHLTINATRPFPGAEITVSAGGENHIHTETDLQPGLPYHSEWEIPTDLSLFDLTLEIRDASGEQLITYRPEEVEEESMPEPVSPLQDADLINDADSLYYQGLYYEQFHDAFYQPRDFYKRAIEINPQHVQALTRTGILYLKEGDPESAAPFLERAVERVGWDYVTPERGDPLYYLALAYRELGRMEEAYELFYKTSWDYNFRSASHYQMALMKSMDGEYRTALEHSREALSINTRSVDLLALQASLYRRTGQPGLAEEMVEKLREIDPLHFRGYFEEYLLKGEQQVLNRMRELMRNSSENYLELAVQYGNAGLYEDAIKLLELSLALNEAELTQDPIIHYTLGYYHHQIGNSSEAASRYQQAGGMPYEYAFPFRFETVKALNSALEYQPEDGLAWYLIGNIYYDHQPEKAIEAWERSTELTRTIPVAHRNLAFAYANVKNDLDATLTNIRRAIELNPDDPRYYYEHDLYLESMQTDPETRLAPFLEKRDVVTSDLTTLFPFVELLTLNGMYSDAIELMRSHHFRRWEGGGSIYPFWIYAHLNRAIDALNENELDEANAFLTSAISYPENLQTVSNQFECIVFYYQGIVAEAKGNMEEARMKFEQSADGSNRSPECRFYAAKAYEKIDDSSSAESIYRSLIQSGNDDLDRDVSVDFFDPFSSVRSDQDRLSEGYLKLALGSLGLGDIEQAEEYFELAEEHNPGLLQLAFRYSPEEARF